MFIVFLYCFLSWNTYAQSTQCLDEDVDLTIIQNISLKDYNWNISSLSEEFTKEFIVLELVDDTCSHCINLANEHNNDADFILRTNDVSTCDYLTITKSWRVKNRIQKIWWIESYVWYKSRELITNELLSLPTLYWWNNVEWVTKVIVLNRKWEIVTQRIWELPESFPTLCLSDHVCSDSDIWIWNNEGWVPWDWSCIYGNGWWEEQKDENCNDNQDNDWDWLKDCDDPDCSEEILCKDDELCDDWVDNDWDWLVDCDDDECFDKPVCEEEEEEEEDW